MFYILIILLI